MKKRKLKRHLWHRNRNQASKSAEWISVHIIAFSHLHVTSSHLLTYHNYSANQRSPWGMRSAVGTIGNSLLCSSLLAYCGFMTRITVLVCPTLTSLIVRYAAWWEQAAAFPDILQDKPRTCFVVPVSLGRVSLYLPMPVNSLYSVLPVLSLQGNVPVLWKLSIKK